MLLLSVHITFFEGIPVMSQLEVISRLRNVVVSGLEKRFGIELKISESFSAR